MNLGWKKSNVVVDFEITSEADDKIWIIRVYLNNRFKVVYRVETFSTLF